MVNKHLFLLILSLEFLCYVELFGSYFPVQNCPTSSEYDADTSTPKIMHNGTTRNIEEIFKGRCHYFLQLQKNSNCAIIQVKRYDCDAIWKAFKSAVTHKSPCGIKIDDFKEFFKLVNHSIPVNSSVFWSGTYTSYHDLVKVKNFMSLEDTFGGYLLNEVTFCSSSSTADFVYKTCPAECVLFDSAFWNAASIDFAKKASGHVKLVLNGTRNTGAVLNSSTFFRYELPYLDVEKVNKLTVFLLHSPGQKRFETCKKPKTLAYLETALEEKQIAYECEDNPENILFLMCFYNIKAKECQALKYLINSNEYLKKKLHMSSILQEKKLVKSVKRVYGPKKHNIRSPHWDKDY